MHHILKKASAFLLALTMCVTMITGAFADNSNGTEKLTCTAIVVDGVRLREQPNTDCKILASMEVDDFVTVLEDPNEGGWLKVRYKEPGGQVLEGYVMEEYLEINAINVGTISTRTAIIRESPEDTAGIVGLGKQGEAVDIFTVLNGWYRVECGSYTGYVSADCVTTAESSTCVGYGTVTGENLNLRKEANGESKSLAKLPKGVTFQITSEQENGWYKAIFNGKTGYVSADYVEVTDSISSGYIQVTATSLGLRSGAGTQFARLASMPCGTLLKVQGTVGDWYAVSYGDFVGYANGAFVSATTSEGFQAWPDRVKVMADNLAMRRAPELSASRITRLAKDTVVAVSGLKDGWYKVTFDGETGYVSPDYVQETTADLTRVERPSSNNSNNSSSSNSSSSSSSSKNKNNNNNSNSSNKKETSGGTVSGGSNSAVLSYAQRFVGNPYKWGGTSLTKGTDCSGFVKSVYAHFGVSLPHSSASMRSVGRKVSVSDMKPGDIVCYSGHVGIYAGNGKLLSALGRKWGITYNSVHYKKILAVRRIF